MLSSKSNNKKTGDKGEEIAARFLMNAGYAILERNYRNRIGEIDIIAKMGKVLVFVEVKTRRTDRFGRPSEAVDFRKRHKITNVARCYVKDNDMEDCHCRFDVVEVMGVGGSWSVNHIKEAFEAC